MLAPVESITDEFGYRVVLVLFSFQPCFLLNMVVGGLTVTDDGGAGHFLLRANRMVEDVECMCR